MIKKAYYAIVFGLLKLVSLLPLKFLYVFAEIMTPFFSRIISYRKKIIKENLSNAFPEWSEQKINKTMLEFYSHFSPYHFV